MIGAERRLKIIEAIERDRIVEVAGLAQGLGVSQVTVRNDLRELEKEGILKRTHGGAVSLSNPSGYEPAFTLREHELRDQKERIGKAAMGYIEEGESIILDSGSTTMQIARHLKKNLNVTVVTNAVNIAAELAHKSVRVVITGGDVNPASLSAVGHLAEKSLREINVDKTFLAAGGVSLDRGITNNSFLDVQVKRAMIDAAGEVILVADSRKFGKVCLAQIGPLSLVHRVITDRDAPADHVEGLREMGIEVILI
ncbi:MAG: DeoR/GlpR transcriptional regulator [Firmicutes bacterium]|nr:DeoR/GlpR transcriptional regulator [Bacillota bacterium]